MLDAARRLVEKNDRLRWRHPEIGLMQNVKSAQGGANCNRGTL
ncbi:hypothetical protein CEV32_4035 [Brucella rhizosphaerae]|uniref:Uncharacterized protein n=1 Tax=Brucella rhizosphaerae TaxID=571254 RepID=A0A256FRH8_9HYPH|nr:hypothetical protein CEV32_4035 [Brucella rhizosphaerae]